MKAALLIAGMLAAPAAGAAREPALAARAGLESLAAADGEARITLDLRDAGVVSIVSLLAEVGGFQVVFDPGLDCALTLKLHEVRWTLALESVLRACRLAYEEDGGVLRVAPAQRLADEARERRRLDEERERSRPRRARTFRLSYARAAELAPLVKRFLSPGGEVVYDARTNTLVIVD